MVLHSSNSLRVYHAKNIFIYFYIAFLLRHMQRVNAAEGKLGQLWLMHHIHINILVRLPEAKYEFAIFNTL